MAPRGQTFAIALGAMGAGLLAVVALPAGLPQLFAGLLVVIASGELLDKAQRDAALELTVQGHVLSKPAVPAVLRILRALAGMCPLFAGGYLAWHTREFGWLPVGGGAALACADEVLRRWYAGEARQRPEDAPSEP
jgi:hypothetical protein